MSSAPESAARDAATVIVLREADRPGPPEILMLKRSGRAGFFPDAWVFPGGRVDPADAQASVRGAVPGLPASDVACAVAALRECFEEAGVWLGAGQPGAELRDRLNRRAATLADAPGLVADLDRLGFWDWWITPVSEPKRYDTRFFLTVVDRAASMQARHDEVETVGSTWVTAAQALEGMDKGDFFLAPPTFLTLGAMSRFNSCNEAFTATRRRRPWPILPRLRRAGPATWGIVLPGDPSYPAHRAVDGPTRVFIDNGRCRAEGGPG